VHEGAGALQAAAGFGVPGIAQQDSAEEVGGLAALVPIEKLEPTSEPAADRVRRRRSQAPQVLT
jgi:hypothetical protein